MSDTLSASSPVKAALTAAVSAKNAVLPGTFSGGDPADALPPTARDKLERARADRDAARSAYLGASDNWREEWAAAGRTEAFAKSRLAMAPGFHVDYAHPAEAALAAAEHRRGRSGTEARIMAPVDAAKRRLAAATAARDRAAERTSTFDFVTTIEDWLRLTARPGAGFSEAPAVQLGRIRDVSAEIAAVRAKLNAVSVEFDELERAPVPAAVLREMAVAEIDGVARGGALAITPSHRGREPLGLVSRLALSTLPRPDGGYSVVGTAGTPMLVWLLRDMLIARIDEMLAPLSQAGALTDDQRDAAFARLANERLELERREEALVMLAEADGRTIVRRPDLDPRAFLGIVA